MIRIYQKKVCLIFFKDESLDQKGFQFSCHLITGGDTKDLSLECFTSYCFSTKNDTKGLQFSCHLITGGDTKDLSLECFTSYCFSTKNDTKEWQFTCHLITGRNVKALSGENVLLRS